MIYKNCIHSSANYMPSEGTKAIVWLLFLESAALF